MFVTSQPAEAAVTVEPDDNASTRGFFPSPSKPNIVEKQPFWKNKKARKWFLAAAFVFAILLAVVITVAVTQSMSGHSSPSATIQTVTASASPLPSSKTSATTSTISGCPTYTGPALTSLPSSITRAGSPAPTPADSNKIATIHFSQGFTYDEASNNDTQTQNAFISIPQGLAYAASGSSSSEFIINTFTPIDTTPQQCFIAMQAKLNLPERYVAALQSQVTASRTDPSVLLWNNPNGNTAALFDTILNINF